MNVMLVCQQGTYSIGMIGHKKTKEYIAGELRTYIKVVGPNDVIQIYSVNASAMLGVLD
jgi:hypothetical protein